MKHLIWITLVVGTLGLLHVSKGVEPSRRVASYAEGNPQTIYQPEPGDEIINVKNGSYIFRLEDQSSTDGNTILFVASGQASVLRPFETMRAGAYLWEMEARTSTVSYSGANRAKLIRQLKIEIGNQYNSTFFEKNPGTRIFVVMKIQDGLRN